MLLRPLLHTLPSQGGPGKLGESFKKAPRGPWGSPREPLDAPGHPPGGGFRMLPESPGCLPRPREGPGRLREAPRRLLESIPESPGRSREGLARVSGSAGRVPGGPGEATGEPVEASRGPRLSESSDKQKPLKTLRKHMFLQPQAGAQGAPEETLAASKNV